MIGQLVVRERAAGRDVRRALVDLLWLRLSSGRGNRGVDVVVDASRGELSARTPNVDGNPGLWWQLRLAPPHDVVLERARAPVVDDVAVFQRDTAVVQNNSS